MSKEWTWARVLLPCERWTNRASWRVLSHFINEVGVFGCAVVPKMISHSHDLRKELCAETRWKLWASGWPMVIMGTLIEETEGKRSWVPRGGHGRPQQQECPTNHMCERVTWTPWVSQPNEVGDAPLFERAPREVANKRRVLRTPARNGSKMWQSIGLGARDAKLKKSTKCGWSALNGRMPMENVCFANDFWIPWMGLRRRKKPSPMRIRWEGMTSLTFSRPYWK